MSGLDLKSRIQVFNSSYEWWEYEAALAMFEYNEIERGDHLGDSTNEKGREELESKIRYLEGKGPFEKKVHDALQKEKADAQKKRK